MDWLNTVLDIGIIGLQMNQRSKLEQLQNQHGQAAAIQAIVQALREEIFNYKQNAEEVLVLEQQEPKIAAGAMKLLDVRLKEFGLTPDMFPDLSDKEYVAATTKLIQDNSRRMMAALPPEDQLEIEQIAHDALMQPKYEYYLLNYQSVQDYRRSQEFIKSKEFFNNGFASLFVIMPIGLILMFGIIALFGFILGKTLGFLIGLGLCVVGGIYYHKNIAQRKEYRESKKLVKNVEQNIDLELFAQAERELGTDYNRVAQQNTEAENHLRNFFDGKTTLVSLPISSTNCGNCGAELPPKGKFCIKCGQPI